MWLFEQLGDVLWTRAVIVFRKTSFSEQEAMFDRLMRLGVKLACIDQTGMGEAVVEDAVRRWGVYRCEGVKFTAPVKAELAGQIRQRFEDRTIRIPISNDVREDLHCVRRMTTTAGNVRFEGETQGSHADRFWAAALGVHAAHNPVRPGMNIL